MKVLLLLIISCYIIFQGNNCFAQAGVLDSSFGNNGVSDAAFTTGSEGSAIAIQPDGKIIEGSSSGGNFCLTRFNTNGRLDSTFGYNGKDSASVGGIGGDNCNSVVIQQDGKLIAGGDVGGYVFAMVRFNANGGLDNSFNGNGQVMVSFGPNANYGYQIALQPDGKILQCGMYAVDSNESDFAVMRLNANGTLDNSFGTGGEVLTAIGNRYAYGYSIAVQPDGKILVSGTSAVDYTPDNFVLARYNTNGTLDSTFGAEGKVTAQFVTNGDDECVSMILQPDGKIVLSGISANAVSSNSSFDFAIARFNPNGTPDSSFGINGKATTDFYGNYDLSRGMALEQDGKILQTGYSEPSNGGDTVVGIAMVRYNTNGTIDSSFGTLGKVYMPTNSIGNMAAFQADGKIIISGQIVNFGGVRVLRFLSGLALGVLNFSSAQNPLLIYPNPIKGQATLQYTLTQNERISLSLYDMPGRQVQTFFTSQTRTAGEHTEELPFSGALASGNYILSISNGHSTQGVKVTVVR